MCDDVMPQVAAGMVRQPARPPRDHLAQRPPVPSAETRERTQSRWQVEIPCTSDSAPESPASHLYLAGTPWSMRTAISTGGRCALEVYAAGSLIDVMVAPSLGSQLLRGACTTVSAGQPRAMAWGCLPKARGAVPFVEFVRSRVRPRPQMEAAENVSAWFWVAAAEGRFSRVVVTSQDERASCRTQRVETC
jgi:hypothetical protein